MPDAFPFAVTEAQPTSVLPGTVTGPHYLLVSTRQPPPKVQVHQRCRLVVDSDGPWTVLPPFATHRAPAYAGGFAVVIRPRVPRVPAATAYEGRRVRIEYPPTPRERVEQVPLLGGDRGR